MTTGSIPRAQMPILARIHRRPCPATNLSRLSRQELRALLPLGAATRSTSGQAYITKPSEIAALPILRDFRPVAPGSRCFQRLLQDGAPTGNRRQFRRMVQKLSTSPESGSARTQMRITLSLRTSKLATEQQDFTARYISAMEWIEALRDPTT